MNFASIGATPLNSRPTSAEMWIFSISRHPISAPCQFGMTRSHRDRCENVMPTPTTVVAKRVDHTARPDVGLPQVRAHDLKHTFGRAFEPLQDRQDVVGQKSRRITTHYSIVELSLVRPRGSTLLVITICSLQLCPHPLSA